MEVPALDPRQSAAFYEQVLGWLIDQRASDDFRFSDGNGLFIDRWTIDGVASRGPGLLPFVHWVKVQKRTARNRSIAFGAATS